MSKRWRSIWGSGVMTVVLMVWATPARADSFLLQWIDNDELVGLRGVTSRNGSVIQDFHFGAGTEDCVSSCFYTLWDSAVLATTFDLRYNIYDQDGVTLSETWEIQGTAGSTNFFSPFHSDSEGRVLEPLVSALSIVESGDFQRVATFFVNNPSGSLSQYNLEFLSERDSAPVPEPASLLLFGTGLIGAGVKSWRKRRTVA